MHGFNMPLTAIGTQKRAGSDIGRPCQAVTLSLVEFSFNEVTLHRRATELAPGQEANATVDHSDSHGPEPHNRDPSRARPESDSGWVGRPHCLEPGGFS